MKAKLRSAAVGLALGLLILAVLCGPMIRPDFAGPASSIADVYENFQSPPPGYSMVPLFRINDRVERNQVRWQLDQMKAVGIHGFFVLPESLHGGFPWKDAGMRYNYLSAGYFQMVREVAEEAKSAGLRLWVYDEQDWPSGAAGGKIIENPKFRSRAVHAGTYNYEGPKSITLELDSHSELLAVTAYQLDGLGFKPDSVHDLASQVSDGRLNWSVPQGRWQVAVYYLRANPGLYTPYDPDLMNAQAMKTFIDLTHKQYLEKVERPVGIQIHGTFTDEPHISSFRNYVSGTSGSKHFTGTLSEAFRGSCLFLPWTTALPGTFEKMKGYDIRKDIPFLYLDGGPKTAKIRCDFWQVVSTMFQDNYFGQIEKFDHAAGWVSTGHLNGEESFWWHLIFDGGNEFANQRQFDYPGLDWILPFDYTPDWGIGWLSAFAGKLVSSVAHVYSKPRVMEETFAGSGYGLSFEKMHRMVNWAYVLGVNMLVPITYKYSLRGADRATSYPPGISYQQPWWSMSKPFNDYVSRLSYLLSRGEFQGQIAFLLPVADVWANSQNREYLDDLTRKVHWANNALLHSHYEFDYVDDDTLQQASIRHRELVIGKNQYRVLILPPMRVASLATLRKAVEFSRAGGKIIALDRLPEGSMENGDPDPEVSALVKPLFGNSPRGGEGPAQLVYLDQTAGSLIQALAAELQPPIRLVGDADQVYSQHRKIGESDVFFLTNDANREREFDALFNVEGDPEIWDPETGSRCAIPGRRQSDGWTRAHIVLRHHESLFVVFNSGLGDAPARRWFTNPVSNFDLTGDWQFKLEPTMTDPHVAWNFTPLPTGWKLKQTGYPDFRRIKAGNWVERGLPYYSGKGVYEKTFDFAPLSPGRRYLLDLGKVGVAAQVWLNGKMVGTRLWQPYAFDVTRFLRPGRNSIRIVVANTLANYFSQFEQLKSASLSGGGTQPWMLPSGLMGPVTIRAYSR